MREKSNRPWTNGSKDAIQNVDEVIPAFPSENQLFFKRFLYSADFQIHLEEKTKKTTMTYNGLLR